MSIDEAQWKAPKQMILGAIERMADDAPMEAIEYEVAFLASVHRGLAQMERGEGVPHEEVIRQLNRWRNSWTVRGLPPDVP